jgi:glycosyltransferase involved in cell wall biosynthesis
MKWVIVSDSSTDGTDAIVRSYAAEYDFISLLRISEHHPRSLSARIRAINSAARLLEGQTYDFIGTVDADVSFGPDYFRTLIGRFLNRETLGIAGGIVQDIGGTTLPTAPGEQHRTVANAAQLLRRECREAIGEYPALPFGAPDTYCEVTARMKGWSVETFPDLIVEHYRHTGSASGFLRGRFLQGQKDFSFGYHPIFEVFKCARRIREKPFVLGALLRMAGFCWSYVRVRRPAVSQDFVHFLRREQLQRLRAFARPLLGIPHPADRSTLQCKYGCKEGNKN